MPQAAGLHYFLQGAAGWSTLLIHGAGGTHLHWPSEVRRLRGRRIIAPDLPGHGRSEGSGCRSISGYAAAILGLMDAIGISQAVMVGHSMGSAVALTIALEHPGRVLGLGLLGTSAKFRVSRAILAALSDDASFPAALDLVMEYSFSRGAGARLKELARKRGESVPRAVWLADFLACSDFDVSGRLASGLPPTLILASAADRMTPLAEARYLRQLAPAARLEILPEAGHMMMQEQPGVVANALDRFLDSIKQRSQALSKP